MQNLLRVLVFFFLTSALACGSETKNENNTTANNENNAAQDVTYYTHIKPLLDAYCTRCHSPEGIAPFALDSWDAVEPVAGIIPASIQDRRMPPFLAAPVVRPLKFDTSLSDAQIQMVTEWVAAGAPSGDPENEGEPLELELSKLSRVDQVLTMPEAYTPTAIGDEYRCFVLDWNETDVSYITGMNVVPGNLNVAHHAALYLVEPQFVDLVVPAQGQDGKGEGYSCFGGPTPPNVSSFPTKLIGGWGPGIEGLDYPAETGLRINPGSKIVLQMHYSILEEGPQPDLSAVELKVDSEIKHSAGNLPWLDVQWPSDPESMLIPAGSTTTHEFVAEVADHPLLGEFAPGVDPSEGVVVYGMFPHLHKLGAKIHLDLDRADGETIPLVHVDEWDFDWQEQYFFQEPIEVLPGDKIRLTCEFDNTQDNQPMIDGAPRPTADVIWGEGTFDEMCVATLYLHGIAENSSDCADAGSVDADSGRFVVTFNTTDAIRNAQNLDGEMRGPVSGSIYRDEDVTILGPNDGAVAVASFDFPEIDLTTGDDGPHVIDVELPAGDYQFLGFMDTDGNADQTGGPDVNDPVMIPARASTLQCSEQPVEIQFPLLLPQM